jgi:nucleotide-binding universal stress UspA family protein
MQVDGDMATAERRSPRFRIVAALDRSEYAEIVLEHAIDQAARHEAPDLHFVTIVRSRQDVDEVKIWLATEVMQGLDTLRSSPADWRSRLHVIEGDPAAEITTLAADLAADLLVIGRFGVHDTKNTIAARVLEHAPCPTLVVNLLDHPVELNPQCPACVEVRENSDGERWFCADHTSSDRVRLSTLLAGSGSLTHGGPLW